MGPLAGGIKCGVWIVEIIEFVRDSAGDKPLAR